MPRRMGGPGGSGGGNSAIAAAFRAAGFAAVIRERDPFAPVAFAMPCLAYPA
jgi:hypothetical protein